MNLRPYQIDVETRLRDELRKGAKSVLCVLPCGSGKSYLMADLCKRATSKGNRVLWLIHRQEILDQTVSTFREYGVDMALMDMYMVQTATRRIEELQPPQLIITDEAAHASANTYTKIYDAFPNAPHIGFTASPCRLNGKPLGDVFDTMVVGVTVSWLIENEFLSPYKYFAPQLADMAGVKKRAGDFDTAEQAKILNKPKIYGDIIGHYNSIVKGGKAIAYCPSVEYSIKLAEEFRAAGIPAAHVDGTTLKNERLAIMEGFRDGTVRVLCNNEIVSEGVSVNDCEAVILLRRTASLALHIQQAGRSMRYLPGKTALVIDHVGNYLQHGLPDTEHEWSLNKTVSTAKKYNVKGELRVRQCPHCFMCFETAPVCPYCGTLYERTREEIQHMEEAVLQEIKARQQAYKDRFKEDCADRVKRYTNVSECRNMSEIMEWCKQNGRKPGYGYHMAKLRGFTR